jgi:glycosyltransferase involved in cell wall biosynthesis
VTFAGAVGQQEITSFYEAADVFCLPSFAEGVPVVLMEAMAMGIPVVATRIAGIPELVEHGTSGLIVPPGRPDQLAHALETLALDLDRRRVMGSAGRAKVCAEFDVRRSARRLSDIFAAELGSSEATLVTTSADPGNSGGADRYESEPDPDLCRSEPVLP